MGPSTTKGAVKPWQRRPATKVWVSQWPNGALACRRSPLRQRPRSRVILVVVPVSSMKTSRCGSWRIRGWRLLLQCSRAWRTSERSCSLARSVFFEPIAVADEPARDRGRHDPGAPRRKFGRELRHRDVTFRGDAVDQEVTMVIKLGVTPAA